MAATGINPWVFGARSPIVTGDPGDLTHIADAIGIKVHFYTT
jgi:hypothetical protein